MLHVLPLPFVPVTCNTRLKQGTALGTEDEGGGGGNEEGREEEKEVGGGRLAMDTWDRPRRRMYSCMSLTVSSRREDDLERASTVCDCSEYRDDTALE